MLSVVPCCCAPAVSQVCCHVFQCATTPLAGATVTISQGGVVKASGTTDASGNVCLSGTWLTAGSYHLDATASGYSTFSDNFTYSGTGSVLLGAYVVPLVSAYIWHITGCTGADLAGATVSINGGTYTTDSNGKVYLSLPAGTYSYTISKSRFVSTTDTLTATHCGGANPVTRSISGAVANIGGPATGYHCYCTCNEPIADTLNLTDGVLGGCTLTYDSTSGAWLGSKHVSAPGVNSSPNCLGPFGLFGVCPSQSSVRVDYGLGCTSGVPTLQVDYTAGSSDFHFSTNCPQTDSGQGVLPQSCTFVSLDCTSFDAEFTKPGYCNCGTGGGCAEQNTLWPGTAPIPMSVTE